MSVFANSNYQLTLREKIRDARRSQRKLTMEKIAHQLPVQYTYLSKALRCPKTHLNEDHLYSLCLLLELLPEEIDFIFLLRSHAMSRDGARKTFLQSKINQCKRRDWRTEVLEENSALSAEDANYLTDPFCILIHACLSQKLVAENPKRLCAAFGISLERLQLVLKKLNLLKCIELDSTGNVTRILKLPPQFRANHPWLASHQSLIRTCSALQLQKLPDSERFTFMSTFGAEASHFKEILQRLKSVFKEVEKLRVRPSEHTFQLNCDFFRWL